MRLATEKRGELLRGEEEVLAFCRALADTFARDMLSTLNTPKNAAKPAFLAMTWKDVEEKIYEEAGEVLDEIFRIKKGDAGGLPAAVLEAIDLGCTAMIAYTKAMDELIKGAK